MSFSRHFDGAHSPAHSILISLFFKTALNIFPLPPLLSAVFVRVFSSWQVLEGTRQAYVLVRYPKEPGYEFLEDLAFNVFPFCKYLVFFPWAFS